MSDGFRQHHEISVERLEAFVFRVPLKIPRINSFGKMTHRTALVVRLIDAGGVEGWGECFCNWPAFAAEHRFRILTEILAPKLAGLSFRSAVSLSEFLNREVRILRLQADEPGPFDQSIAAVDIAAWDLLARKAGEPLYKYLGATGTVQSVPYYASGLSPDQASRIAERELKKGTRAFKSKVGWEKQADLESLSELREVIGPETTLMVDVNQKWDMKTAREMIPLLKPFDLSWVEEPISADHPASCFSELAAFGVPIAAGENVRGFSDFRSLINEGQLAVLQPDIIKWGGISGCLSVAKSALGMGRRYCPHYLGGGIGLMATAHLLAATGGDGVLELDATPNTLREALADPYPILRDGQFVIPQSPGLGLTPDLKALSRYQHAM